VKPDPAEKELRERMRPGILAKDGFLGTDSRTIADIIEADVAEIEAAGLDTARIAELLEDLLLAAEEALETPRRLCGGAVTVRFIEGMGRIPCPFACGFRGRKGVVELTSPTLNLQFTALHAHLIRGHGFFQGRGAAFRLEPADAVALYRICRKPQQPDAPGTPSRDGATSP